MSEATAPEPGAPPAGGPGRGGIERSAARRADQAFGFGARAAAVGVLALLTAIAAVTLKEAWPTFRSEGLGFVTGRRWAPNDAVFGALPFLFGTLYVSVLALLFAVPTSIGLALFVTEVAGRRTRAVVTFVTDLLAAVPSVVFGLWGVSVLAKAAPGFYAAIGEPLSAVPGLGKAFDGPYNGKSFLTAGFILGLMITPIITSICREVFTTTPVGQKHAALALGATRWEMLRGTVLPHSAAGAAGAVLLGLGRAMGETIAAALVIGAGSQISPSLFASGDSLAARIANEFGEGVGVADWRAALIGLGVLLFVMTIFVNLLAEAIVRRAKVAS